MYKPHKIILLPTKYASRIHKRIVTSVYGKEGSIEFMENTTGNTKFTSDLDPQFYYILSEEEIKEGDWCLDKYKQLWKLEDNSLVGYDVFGNKKFRTDNVKGHESVKIISSNNSTLLLPKLEDKDLQTWCNNPTDTIMIKWTVIYPTMKNHGLDSRGDSIYYCPTCGKGGSYMGIIRAEDIPKCYSESCQKLKSPDNKISVKFEDNWGDVILKYKEYTLAIANEPNNKAQWRQKVLPFEYWVQQNYEPPIKRNNGNSENKA